ncbi:MAG: AAA family ATPase [Holosporales bacterium]|nr:AAA family ATPase [Holosporales bacterium]
MTASPFFTELIGHKQAQERLAHALSMGMLSSSLLIAGSPGIGKALLAQKLACAILSCKMPFDSGNTKDSLYCAADVVRLAQEGTHPDLGISSGYQEGSSVEHVRNVLGKIYRKPILARSKVIIFEDVDLFNRNAANALLKTLEEPPSDTFIILTSSRPERLLQTVRSRCLLTQLAPLSATEMECVLEQYKIALPKALIPLCEGSPGKAFMVQERAELYPRFLHSLRAAESNSFEPAQAFVEEENIWPIFCWFTLYVLHQAACVDAAIQEDAALVNPFQDKGVSCVRMATLWQEVIYKITQTDRLNLDKKAVMLWFFCYVKDVLHGEF